MESRLLPITEVEETKIAVAEVDTALFNRMKPLPGLVDAVLVEKV